MPEERRKPAGSGKAPQDWGIVVRLADGTQLYYYVDEWHVDSQGNPLERWGRMSQAHRIPFRGARTPRSRHNADHLRGKRVHSRAPHPTRCALGWPQLRFSNRPVCRDPVETHLTTVFAAPANSRWAQDRTG